VLPLINQNIEIPASGGQLLVSVPEGMEEFVIRLDQLGSQIIQICPPHE